MTAFFYRAGQCRTCRVKAGTGDCADCRDLTEALTGLMQAALKHVGLDSVPCGNCGAARFQKAGGGRVEKCLVCEDEEYDPALIAEKLEELAL